jgi:hypothetical protein
LIAESNWVFHILSKQFRGPSAIHQGPKRKRM